MGATRTTNVDMHVVPLGEALQKVPSRDGSHARMAKELASGKNFVDGWPLLLGGSLAALALDLVVRLLFLVHWFYEIKMKVANIDLLSQQMNAGFTGMVSSAGRSDALNNRPGGASGASVGETASRYFSDAGRTLSKTVIGLTAAGCFFFATGGVVDYFDARWSTQSFTGLTEVKVPNVVIVGSNHTPLTQVQRADEDPGSWAYYWTCFFAFFCLMAVQLPATFAFEGGRFGRSSNKSMYIQSCGISMVGCVCLAYQQVNANAAALAWEV